MKTRRWFSSSSFLRSSSLSSFPSFSSPLIEGGDTGKAGANEKEANVEKAVAREEAADDVKARTPDKAKVIEKERELEEAVGVVITRAFD